MMFRMLVVSLLALLPAALADGHGDDDMSCTPSMEVEVAIPGMAMDPPLPGIMPGKAMPKLVLAQDVDWPPYAYVASPPEGDFVVAGFGHDFAMGMGAMCGLEVVTVQADWEECWGSNKIGDSLRSGLYHGCMTYTHTAGVRNRYMEFSLPILNDNAPAGLLTRLSNGVPVIDGHNTLNGLRVADVVGWAPTADTLALVENGCTGGSFSNFTMVAPNYTDIPNANDQALKMLLDGEVDAVWIYAGHARNYIDCTVGVTTEWDCEMWKGFGTTFAYVQTGMYRHAFNGTTLVMARKGAGVKEIVNPCIESFIQTEEYYNICEKHGFTQQCFTNSFFPASSTESLPHLLKTSELTTTCADGYCPCPA